MKKLALFAVALSALTLNTANAGGISYCDYQPWRGQCQDTVNDFRDLRRQGEVSFYSILERRIQTWSDVREILTQISTWTNTKHALYNKIVWSQASNYCGKRRNAGKAICAPQPDPVVTVPEPSTLGLLGLGLLAFGVARRRRLRA